MPYTTLVRYYVAHAALQVTLIVRPDKIVFGGGVTSEKFLEKVRRDVAKVVNGYVHVPELDQYIVMPEIENNGSATVGDFALAKRLLRE